MTTRREYINKRQDEIIAELTAMANANDEIIKSTQEVINMLKRPAELSRPEARVHYES